jgi:hypothetical protein
MDHGVPRPILKNSVLSAKNPWEVKKIVTIEVHEFTKKKLDNFVVNFFLIKSQSKLINIQTT